MDYLVIGAGAAGLQLGYFLSRAGRDYRIVEAGERPGTFFSTFPRHRKLISSNKRYTGWDDPELNLRMDWNSLLSDDSSLRFTRYSDDYFPPADDMVRYLGDFALAHRLPIKTSTRIARISRCNGAFRAIDETGEVYEAKRLIVASGVSKPYVPPIPGIEAAEDYGTVSVNPRDFVNQRVLIIGKGNSAFETADNLLETAAVIHVAGPSSIRFAWQSHYVGHLRAVNNNFLDTYQLKSQNALLDGRVERIERRGNSYVVTFSFSRANEVKKDLCYDRVIVCTGFRFDASIFDEECQPELVLHNRFPAQTSQWESTNIPGLHFAGTLMQVRDYRKSTGGFIHGFRYCVRSLHRILERKYHGVAWPHSCLNADPRDLTEAVIARVNRTSALWQQFGFLCDLIVISNDGKARYYEELPADYVHSSDFGTAQRYVTITLEYGPDHDRIDPFDISISRVAQNDAEHSYDARYLHPVVRFFSGSELIAEHHVAENLENEWTGPSHREPLRAFLDRITAPGPVGVRRPVKPRAAFQPVSLRDVESAARRRLDPAIHDFFAGGAEDEWTLLRNESAFARIGIVPRVLRGARQCDLAISVLGCHASFPVIVAPTAFHCLADADGERATVRAAAAAGTIMIVSMASTVAIEEVAAAARRANADAGPTLWFQLYVQPDLDFTEALIRRAETAGCSALVVTVDSPTFGRRERDMRNAFHDLPPHLFCENLRESTEAGGRVRRIDFSREISWRHVDWLRSVTKLKIVLKGVVNPLDAQLALEHGVDALLVSNHGGRQLDTVPAAIDLLPHIAAVVGSRIPVLLDGGIRRGTDIVKALALGANAVAIGRPILWGLASAGEEGVARVLEILRSELDVALTLCGCGSLSEIDLGLIRFEQMGFGQC